MHTLCKHDPNTAKVNESEEPRCQFVEAGSNTTVFLYAVEEALYEMPFLVLMPVTIPRSHCVGFGWYAVIGIMVCNIVPQFLRTICFVTHYDRSIQINMT